VQRERKLQLLRQVLKQPGRNLGNDEYAFFCPKHGSRSDRVVGQLGINISTDKFNCYSCGFSGKTLLFLFHKDSPEWEEYRASLDGSKPKDQEKKFEHPALPPEFKTLSKEWKTPYYTGAMNYLKNRGIGRREILKWKLGYCEDGKYKNRIVIPSFDEFGMLNFLTGRAFYEGVDRYYNGNFCKDIIFNDYLIDWRKAVVITEGPFDAIKVDENAIALQGSLLSSGTRLFTKVVLSGVDVFMALDKDAFSKQLDIIENLVSYGVVCRLVPLGRRKDVGEMTKEEFAMAKRKSTIVSSDIDLLKLRMCS